VSANAATRSRAAEALHSAPDDSEALVNHIFAHPVLLRTDLGDMLTKAPEQTATMITQIREWLAQHPEDYPVGPGPIEGIWRQLDDGELSVEQAAVLSRHMSVTEGLSALMVSALSIAARDLALSGEWRAAIAHQRIVQAAVSADASVDIRVAGIRGFLHVVQFTLITVPDRRLLEEATELAEPLIAELLDDSQDQAAADVLFDLGVSWSDPYTVDRLTDSYEQADRQWEARGSEAHTRDGIAEDEADWRMPPRRDALRRAEQYLRRALKLKDEGPRRKALVQVLVWRNQTGDGVDKAEVVSAAQSALAAIDADTAPEPRLSILAALQVYDVPIDRSEVDAILSPSLDELVRRHGPVTTIDLHFQSTTILRDVDPMGALAVLARVRPLVQRSPNQERRRVMLDLTHRALNRAYGHHITDTKPTGGVRQRREELVSEASAHEWDVAELAVALLMLAIFSGNWDEEDDGLAVMADAARIAPLLADEYTSLFTLTRARLHLGAAVNAVNAREFDKALERYAEAITHYDALGLDDEVEDCLRRILDLADDADSNESVVRVIATLMMLALPLEQRLGERGSVALAEICRSLFRALLLRPVNPELLALLLELAKGHRLGAALAGGLAAPAEDAEATALLAEIEGLATSAPPPPPDLLVSEAQLVSVYESHALPGRTAGERLVNLQRTFDQRHEQSLLSRVTRSTPVLMGMKNLQRALDKRTVLASLYVGFTPDGDRGVVTLLVTDDDMSLGMSVDPELAGAIVQIGDEPFSATVSPDAFLVASLRMNLQEQDPGPAPVLEETQSTLGSMGDRIFGSVRDKLQALRSSGRDHLCILPHGPLHFLPYALLGSQDEEGCLADNWVVTLLPNLQLLLGRRGQPGVRIEGLSTMSAVGVGFVDIPGVDPIPEAVDEAQAVADLFGTTPILDADATKDAVTSALQSSRYVHIATHGEQNVGAPSFQSLFLASPERLYAHEIAGLDAVGLQMVTLSACETALGRFDTADNLQGLVPSLFLAGVETVAGTLWQVETGASQAFFTKFYESLHRGASRVDAFAEAQRATRTAFPAYRDWGAFELFGAWS
jgi:hypothetical protein